MKPTTLNKHGDLIDIMLICIDTEFKRIESYRTSNDDRMFDAG